MFLMNFQKLLFGLTFQARYQTVIEHQVYSVYILNAQAITSMEGYKASFYCLFLSHFST